MPRLIRTARVLVLRMQVQDIVTLQAADVAFFWAYPRQEEITTYFAVLETSKGQYKVVARCYRSGSADNGVLIVP